MTKPTLRRGATALLVITFAVVTSCTKTVYVPQERIRLVEQIVKDTVVDVRLEREYESVTTPDTISILENKHSRSKAEWSNQTLKHDLETKESRIPVEIKYIETHTTDTIRDTVIQEVEKIVTKRHVPKFYSFTLWWFVANVVMGAAWILRRIKLYR